MLGVILLAKIAAGSVAALFLAGLFDYLVARAIRKSRAKHNAALHRATGMTWRPGGDK